MTFLKEIKLKNFRNFSNEKLLISESLTQIIWNNWKWKTNILEAIALLTWNDFLWINFNHLINKNEDIFFIQANIDWINFSISFDKIKNKKTYFIWDKKTTKNKFNEKTIKSVVFDPQFMNLMYFSPSNRRDYIDSLLSNTFPGYNKLIIMYKNTLKNRNKILKNIWIWKSNIDEIYFWNNEFIKQAIEIYKYRFFLNKYIINNIVSYKDFFLWKIDKINFKYITNIDINNIENNLKDYLENNLNKDILLWTTRIWPHIDDFDITIDNISIKDFSSRWEMKSILIWLKLIELKFLEENTKQKPILLIDDLYSEIDDKHKELLLKYIEKYQTITTSIIPISSEYWNIINI